MSTHSIETIKQEVKEAQAKQSPSLVETLILSTQEAISNNQKARIDLQDKLIILEEEGRKLKAGLKALMPKGNAKEIANQVTGTKIVRGDDESAESFMDRLKKAGLTEPEDLTERK